MWRTLAATLAPIVFISAASTPDITQSTSAREPQRSGYGRQRGEDLRKSLDEAVRTRPLTGRLGGTDISDVVLPYISTGMTFIDAETILRDAGFDVGPYPDLREANDQNRSMDWYAVSAHVPFFNRGLFSRADVYVSLFPERPGDYSNVVKIVAVALVAMP